MAKIEREAQYEWAVKRVEALLPLVGDDAPEDDPARIELELLSELVSEYSEEHFAIGEPSLVDILKLRMYEMGLTQKRAGRPARHQPFPPVRPAGRQVRTDHQDRPHDQP